MATIAVPRGPYRIAAEVTPGAGAPVVLMHGFPDNMHLYDPLMPHLAGRRPTVRFGHFVQVDEPARVADLIDPR